MNRPFVATRLQNWKLQIRQALVSSGSQPNPASSPEWYTGLAVSPALFSEQLGKMHVSLLRANSRPDQPQACRLNAGMAQ